MKTLLSCILLLIFSYSEDALCQDVVLSGDELFGNIEARHIGPALMSGRIIDLEVHPVNNRIIYTGTAGGGVWKSSNGGATFQPIFDEYAQSIGVVTLDPNNPDRVIWVGTGEIWTRNSVSIGDGLYRSSDGGINWTKIGFEHSERISSIEIDPENSNIVYLGVLGTLWGDSDERGVYKTSDGGQTWDRVLYVDEKTGCADLIMDPVNSSTLYASMWEFRRTAWSFRSGGDKSALYKSTDSGKTWHKIHHGFPEGKLGRIAVALAPSNPEILYTVLESEKNEDKGLYRSDDAGASWVHLNNDFGLLVRPFYFSRIVVDPRNPDVVVKGGLYGSISRDGGKTFKAMGPMHADIHDVAFDIHDSDRMYVGTDGGIYRSWDGGTTMEIVENLPLSQFYHISVDNEDPYNVYGGLQDNGSWYGPSSSPGGVEARDWNSVGYGDGFRVFRHLTKPIVYSEMQGAENVWRYNIERKQAKSIQPLPEQGDVKLRFNWNAAMAVSKHNPDRIFMGSQFLHVSEDMGDSWEIISPDLTTNDPDKQLQQESGGLSVDNSGAENHCTIFTIAESEIDQNIIWVGTDDGNVQLTRDGGRSWMNTVDNIPDLPPNTWCYHIEASVHDPATAYAVFDGHTQNDMNTYVYKTSDFGKTWESLTSENIVSFARNIQEDYVNPDLLFLGTEFGLFITIDGGRNWSRFTNNMPATAVHFIELHRETHDLVMGTHGRGVIIIDDISPLREINQDVLRKDVHFFTSRPSVIFEESGFGGGSTETQFVGQNPSRSAKIIYYLKKRHIFGKLSLEVQDMNGQKLVELPAGKSKGINLITWNGTIKQPKMAKGKTLTFGGFTPPRVPAGRYKVVMNKGKDRYETVIELINDPNSILTLAERQKLHQTTMKLYDMAQELAYIVYEIDEFIGKAKEIEEKDSDAKGKELASQVANELNQLKETLVITTGDNYVATAEPQLREKIANLYSKIASSFVPPSPSELSNLKLLEDTFKAAKAKLQKLKEGKVNDMLNWLESQQMEGVQLMNFEAFLKTS